MTMDGAHNMTVNETPQDVDGRYPKAFDLAFQACQKMIERMIVFSEVEVVWVPGNHDRTTSYHLVREIAAYFHRCDRVKVDASPKSRKYRAYGPALIGWTHGDMERHADLPNIMATEQKELWAKSTHREWHLGHWHKSKETRFAAADTHQSVVVRVLPSLCGTDAWHYNKGYVGHPRAAEAYLWDKSQGYVGHFSIAVRNTKP